MEPEQPGKKIQTSLKDQELLDDLNIDIRMDGTFFFTSIILFKFRVLMIFFCQGLIYILCQHLGFKEFLNRAYQTKYALLVAIELYFIVISFHSRSQLSCKITRVCTLTLMTYIMYVMLMFQIYEFASDQNSPMFRDMFMESTHGTIIKVCMLQAITIDWLCNRLDFYQNDAFLAGGLTLSIPVIFFLLSNKPWGDALDTHIFYQIILFFCSMTIVYTSKNFYVAFMMRRETWQEQESGNYISNDNNNQKDISELGYDISETIDTSNDRMGTTTSNFEIEVKID